MVVTKKLKKYIKKLKKNTILVDYIILILKECVIYILQLGNLVEHRVRYLEKAGYRALYLMDS